jgi:hypothetical protein
MFPFQSGDIMKSVLFTVLILINIATKAQLQGTLEINCSNPTGDIFYHVTDNSERLFVTKKFPLEDGIVGKIQIQLTDINISLVTEQELSSEWSSTCDIKSESEGSIKGIKTLKNLSFKKVRVSKKTGEVLPEGIVGLSDDGKTLEVEYLCDKRINEEVACE